MTRERVVTMGRLASKVCAHRRVDRDGRIVCNKILEGDNEVSPNICRDCPARQIACDKLRFSLQKFSPSPIVVRYGNGHTEVWGDEPARISFLRAACVAKIMPISDPRQCAGCALRHVDEPIIEEVALPGVAAGGKVIAFPQRAAAAAS
jgi:hypothetical protein